MKRLGDGLGLQHIVVCDREPLPDERPDHLLVIDDEDRIEVGEVGRLVTDGTWSTSRGGSADLCQTTVNLAGSPDDFTHYLLVGDNLLLMLDTNLEPRVGNAVHSFTLSRTE